MEIISTTVMRQIDCHIILDGCKVLLYIIQNDNAARYMFLQLSDVVCSSIGNTYDNGRHHVERGRVRHDLPAAEGKDYPRGDHPQSSGCL